MEKIEMLTLYGYDYSLTVINALKQNRNNLNLFNCIGKPKIYNMLLYLDGCKALYRLKNGERINVDNGGIVYTPINSEYNVEFYDFKSKDSGTIGINFLLCNSKKQPFVLSDNIQIFNVDNTNYRLLFNQIANYSKANIQCKGKIKSIMYDILFRLSEFFHNNYSGKYHVIAKGIAYLEQDEDQKLRISEIAEMCNVSEVYFRKLFKEYSGLSPTQYKATTKIYRAKNYLKQDSLSISEISHLLAFEDVSYFVKFFREQTGLTPNKYRKSFENKLKISNSPKEYREQIK